MTCKVEQCERIGAYRKRTLCVKHYRESISPAEPDPEIAPVDKEPVKRLDAGPFASWLRPKIATGDFIDYDKTLRDLLYKIADGRRQFVRLDTVDKVLCTYGDPGHLRHLYPELYVFTEKQMRKAERWAQG